MADLDSPKVQQLSQIVEESTRSTREGVKYFIEPAPNTLNRAKSKRHHIIFGRRGSGKSSLLAKVSTDLTTVRVPNAYIDLEKFKGHSYPDVLISVLIEAIGEFRKWLETAAVEPASRTSFWQKLVGTKPSKKSLDKDKAADLATKLRDAEKALKTTLHSADEAKRQETKKAEHAADVEGKLGSSVKTPVGGVDASLSASEKTGRSHEIKDEYSSRKIEVLHRNILVYKELFTEISALSDGSSFLLLDDLYHIRPNDQAHVLDYFHRIAKGSGLWIKVGTIRHRSRWYVFGTPPIGMKIGDDAESIDLDVTLEKYDLTKKFLLRILDQFARQSGLKLEDILTDGARDRLVLASGGVARDFLSIFRRAIDIALERTTRGELARGEKIGAEDVNKAAGEYDSSKREDFTRDSGSDRDELLQTFASVSAFCLDHSKANCFLIDKDLRDDEEVDHVAELVDLKFLHHVKSRVTVRDRPNRVYDGYMLDLSQYAGERARRNFDIIEFWGADGDDSLRKTKLIFAERNR
ncbi:MAG TPA: hypothetical protein VHD59_07535 [Pseudolabrys sp.]|nr:hypothetical protein [Pseudolabrys sp.]